MDDILDDEILKDDDLADADHSLSDVPELPDKLVKIKL